MLKESSVDSESQLNRLLRYRQHYEAFLDKRLRLAGHDRGLIYCLGHWLLPTQGLKFREVFRQKRSATFFVTHFLALLLLGFAVAFYFAFAWYFFP
jgi:hypothetical protein